MGEASLYMQHQRGEIPMYTTITEAAVRKFLVIEWRNHVSLSENFWIISAWGLHTTPQTLRNDPPASPQWQ